ncbi:recombinase family protein [Streptococcus anginosus]|uniref:recombinase family protein n=1 Tax=Streptococcus anginosus TaxID=1328 RepID=UPI0021F90DD7|nr:recombinase family protein [Streptococcus anginosus]MCW1089546.1 recombinase family protein [Streptococcus anginosus]
MQLTVTHQQVTKIRVAAYCRVSTDQDEQLSSYENQVNYYRDFISKHEDYELVDIYADEGISATNTKKRDAFNRLIQDCRDGKVDRILVKSISRFARNTLDCIKYVRELKELGVGVTFEKENIDSLDSKGEVLLTILSSLAQDESRSISENATWGIRKKFERGEVRVNTTKFMGYDKDENGKLVINPEQAEVVRHIYGQFLKGYSPESIAKELNVKDIKGWSGKANWYPSAILKMLQNEKYKGDALLQKTYTVDFLTKKRTENDGQVNQYYNSFIRIKSREADFERLLEKYSVLRNDEIKAFQLDFQRLPISLHQFQVNRDKISIFLEDISSKIGFDFSKSSDPQNLFDRYFASDEKIFKKCTIEDISKKRDYIINQFEIQQLTLLNLLDKRLHLIDKTVNYLQQRIRKLNNNIKEYQVQMIEKLKLPFYIYTAKILQNYQQGMGVLLTTQNNSNIRFIANSNSEQDVMYQLSSGQIAVISFAFTLALNTTFKISKDFKLLTIDDPIQDMDSMNVYALIDLLRHALPEYQILMSTHNDGSAMFIKYKFELFSDSGISKVGLKNIFLTTS